jgi:hypothetical protein
VRALVQWIINGAFDPSQIVRDEANHTEREESFLRSNQLAARLSVPGRSYAYANVRFHGEAGPAGIVSGSYCV